MKRFVAILVFAASLSGCGMVLDDAEYVIPRANEYYESRGFEVLGYQGYNIWTIGRCYWFTTKRANVVYESCLLKWNDELHEYSFKAIDAVKGG